MIVSESVESQASLPQLADALDSLGVRLGLAQGRKKQGRENAYDGDDAQQLNQREALAGSVHLHLLGCIASMSDAEWICSQNAFGIDLALEIFTQYA